MITDYQCKGILAKQIAATPDSTGLGTLAKDVDSELPEGSSERLDFLGETAPIREWIGDREPSTPIEYNFAIKNRKFEVTTNFPKAWVKGDKTGNVARSMQGLANRNSQWRSKLVAALLNDGATGNLFRGFDGLPFFANNHAYGVSTINNIVGLHTANGPTLPTVYEVAQIIVQAYQQILSFTDDRGEPMNEDIDALAIAVPIVQGSKLAVAVGQALSLAKIDTGTGSVDNPVLEVKDNCKVRLVRSVRLTGNQFYMINDSGNSVPLIVQENKAEAEMTSKAGGSDYEHDTDRWEFGMKRVGNGGFGRFADVVQIPLT